MFVNPTVSAEASNNNLSLSSSSSIPMQQLPAGHTGAAASPCFDGPADSAELCLATCCLRRASSSRQENYYYTLDTGGRETPKIASVEDTLSSWLALRVFSGRSVSLDAVLEIRPTGHSNGETAAGNGEWAAFIADGVMFLHPPSYGVWVADEFRESVLAVMELAELLNCEQLVVCLEKERDDSSDMVRAFMYAGFELVCPDIFQQDASFVLLGSDV